MKKSDLQLIRFSSSNFKTLPSDQKIEEEAHGPISKGRYYPVRVGDIIKDKIVGKLGYGLGSTVLLANEFR